VITLYRRADIHHLVQAEGWTVEDDSVAAPPTQITSHGFASMIKLLR